VRNRYDGAVEIEAEGQKPALEAFVAEVRIGPRAAHITAVDVVWLPYEGKYKGFDVTY
jgi:acylphosphatase